MIVLIWCIHGKHEVFKIHDYTVIFMKLHWHLRFENKILKKNILEILDFQTKTVLNFGVYEQNTSVSIFENNSCYRRSRNYGQAVPLK